MTEVLDALSTDPLVRWIVGDPLRAACCMSVAVLVWIAWNLFVVRLVLSWVKRDE